MRDDDGLRRSSHEALVLGMTHIISMHNACVREITKKNDEIAALRAENTALREAGNHLRDSLSGIASIEDLRAIATWDALTHDAPTDSVQVSSRLVVPDATLDENIVIPGAIVAGNSREVRLKEISSTTFHEDECHDSDCPGCYKRTGPQAES